MVWCYEQICPAFYRLDFCLPLAQSPFHSLLLSAPPPPPPFPAFKPPMPLNAPPPPLFFRPPAAAVAAALAPEAEKGGRLVLHPPPPSEPPAPPTSLAAGSSKPVRAQLSSATPAPAAPGTLDMKTNLEAETVVRPDAREPERAWRLPDRDRNEPFRWTCAALVWVRLGLVSFGFGFVWVRFAG